MCKISDNLKLCSCKPAERKHLKHYWVLSRPNLRGEEILGDIILPADIDLSTEFHNRETLSRLINTGECFDVEMNHRENDVLILHFSCRDSYLAYSFVFSENEWKYKEYDPFENGLDRVKKGTVIGGLLE